MKFYEISGKFYPEDVVFKLVPIIQWYDDGNDVTALRFSLWAKGVFRLCSCTSFRFFYNWRCYSKSKISIINPKVVVESRVISSSSSSSSNSSSSSSSDNSKDNHHHYHYKHIFLCWEIILTIA